VPARLAFDRGTITLTGLPANEAAGLPGVLWDARVRVHRAPAYRYAELRAALAGAGRPCHDDVRVRGENASSAPAAPELRSYQVAALASWELSGARGLVVLPTGSGKTRLAVAAIARRRGRALCLVPTRVLLEQWRGVLEGALGSPIGQYGDGSRTLRPVTVATFASAHRHMERIGNRFDLLVIDEVHHFGGGPNDEALELCAAPARLGLTATPPSDAARRTRLEALVGPIVYQQRISDLTGEYLAPLRVDTLWLDLTPDERQSYALETGIYQPLVRQFFRYAPHATWRAFQSAALRTGEGRRALAAWRRARSLLTFTQAKQAALDRLLAEQRHRRILVFTGDNDAAYRIAREHCIMPITRDIGRAERKQALDGFREGSLRALVSAQVLNEGLDVPDADVAILVGGRLGTREYLQRLGRLLRPAPGKQAVAYELVTRGTHEARDALRGRRALAS
jgi:superfamily II DNA or RNA helicase